MAAAESIDPRLPVHTAFDEAYRALGGRVVQSLDFLEPWHTRYNTILGTLAGDPKSPFALARLHVDLIAKGDLNACVVHHRGYHLIGVTFGAIRNLALFSLVLLSRPDMLEFIGDSRLEENWCVEPFAESFSLSQPPPVNWASDRVVSRFPDPPEETPRCLNRRKAVALLQDMAMDFIFFHEVGHVILRHLESMERSGATPFLQECGSRKVLAATFHQACELEADQFAVQIILKWFQGLGYCGAGVFHNTEDAVMAWSFMICILFGIFGQGQGDILSTQDRTHPHPQVRMAHVIDTAMSMAGSVNGVKTQAYCAALFSGALLAEQACEALPLYSSTWKLDLKGIDREHERLRRSMTCEMKDCDVTTFRSEDLKSEKQRLEIAYEGLVCNAQDIVYWDMLGEELTERIKTKVNMVVAQLLVRQALLDGFIEQCIHVSGYCEPRVVQKLARFASNLDLEPAQRAYAKFDEKWKT